MKIGVHTLPLNWNYGGHLQAYALVAVLKEMGHDAWLINRKLNKFSLPLIPVAIGNRLVKKFILKRKNIRMFGGILEDKDAALLEHNTRDFISRNIKPQTVPFYSTKQLSRGINDYDFDAIMFGSDQVWRPNFPPCLHEYFGSFVKSANAPKLIAYSASFGTDEWICKKQLQKKCAKLVKNFKAVSVREDSGVDICKKHLGIDAEQTLDPTLLLSSEHYLGLLPDSKKKKRGIFVYILDESVGKGCLVEQVSKSLDLPVFSITVKDNSDCNQALNSAPQTEDWIRAFHEADFVITDSFHGCVFSIIFNKQFIAYGNAERGMTRFSSLLRIFGLENQLVTRMSNVELPKLLAPFNWDAINETLKRWQDKSKKYIEHALSVK